MREPIPDNREGLCKVFFGPGTIFLRRDAGHGACHFVTNIHQVSGSAYFTGILTTSARRCAPSYNG